MLIKFDTNLKMDGFNISHINSTVFNITVEPALGRDQDEGFEWKSVALKWNAIKLED